jgi:hypothetical protein
MFAALGCLRAIPLTAHEIGQSISRIDVRGRDVSVVLTFSLLELGYVDRNGDQVVSYDELDPAIERVYADIRKHYVLQAPAAPVKATLSRYAVIDDHILQMDLLFAFEQDVSQLDVTSTLFQITRPDHQDLIGVTMDGTVQESVLNQRNHRVVFTPVETSRLETMRRFLTLGVEHLMTGYDLLAFLSVLLIGATSLTSLIAIVTSFTVAHSVTLALATFNIVNLPGRLTESLIAATIAYVAAENLFKSRAVERYVLTFIFGLIHGFGFATILRDMQLPRGHLALSLLSFNVGVEIGQIAFVGLLFPLVFYLARIRVTHVVRPAVSGVVLCLAIYWFVQRALLT